MPFPWIGTAPKRGKPTAGNSSLPEAQRQIVVALRREGDRRAKDRTAALQKRTEERDRNKGREERVLRAEGRRAANSVSSIRISIPVIIDKAARDYLTALRVPKSKPDGGAAEAQQQPAPLLLSVKFDPASNTAGIVEKKVNQTAQANAARENGKQAIAPVSLRGFSGQPTRARTSERLNNENAQGEGVGAAQPAGQQGKPNGEQRNLSRATFGVRLSTEGDHEKHLAIEYFRPSSLSALTRARLAGQGVIADKTRLARSAIKAGAKVDPGLPKKRDAADNAADSNKQAGGEGQGERQ